MTSRTVHPVIPSLLTSKANGIRPISVPGIILLLLFTFCLPLLHRDSLVPMPIDMPMQAQA